MEIGQPTGMGSSALPADQDDASTGGAPAFYVVMLPDGMVTIEQLQPGQAPTGNARPVELGDALEQLVEASEAAGSGAEQSAFESGFAGGGARKARDMPPGMRNGGLARAVR